MLVKDGASSSEPVVAVLVIDVLPLGFKTLFLLLLFLRLLLPCQPPCVTLLSLWRPAAALRRRLVRGAAGGAEEEKGATGSMAA